MLDTLRIYRSHIGQLIDPAFGKYRSVGRWRGLRLSGIDDFACSNNRRREQGAVFWMWLAALLEIATKYFECMMAGLGDGNGVQSHEIASVLSS